MMMPTKGILGIPFTAVRIIVSGFSGLVFVWAIYIGSMLWTQSPIENIAKHIIAQDSFKVESLTSLQTTFDLEKVPVPRGGTLSARAILNVRLLELTIGRSDQKDIDRSMKETSELILESLENSPADPFLWTVLFWLENTRIGFSRARLEYLGMSYSVGPNEGWVAVKRNRFALAIFPSLTPDTSKNAVDEFSRLVGSNYLGAAADILEGPGWPIRETLLAGLKDVDEVNRQSFARLIYRRGFDLMVPGVERPDWRPWH